MTDSENQTPFIPERGHASFIFAMLIGTLILAVVIGGSYILHSTVKRDRLIAEQRARQVAVEKKAQSDLRAATLNKTTGLFLSGEEWDALSEKERLALINRKTQPIAEEVQ